MQGDDLSVRVVWLGSDAVLLELDRVPSNSVVQVSADLRSWQDQLDVCTRSNRVQVFDRDASPATESARFYRVRVPGLPVEAARSRWQAQGVRNYTYHFHRSCFCLAEIIREADVLVRAGRVVGATNVVYGRSPDPSWTPPVQPDLSGLKTIEEFFDLVAVAQQESDLVSVSYDPVMGFPHQITVDPVFGMVDDESEYRVDRVVPEPGWGS